MAATFLLCGLAAVLALIALKLRDETAKKVLAGTRWAMLVAAGLSVLTLLLLALAFLTDNFSIVIVRRHSASYLPLLYKLSAIWASSSGSLLLWSVIVFVLFALWQIANSKSQTKSIYEQSVISDSKFDAAALFVGAGLCLAFSALLIFVAKPFASSPLVAKDGAGLNPVLQNFWMVVHLPSLFIGYSAFMIPFVIVLACVFAERAQDPGVYRQLHRWLLIGICFLSLGIATKAGWSYLELGGGIYWAWDPAENALLLPFLAAIAALHSLIGMRVADKFRFWTITLAPLPFILCLFAIFITRSGILTSLHSFSEPIMPSALSAFIGYCFLLWLFCVAHAVRSVSISPSKNTIFHLDKSEVMFWANVVFITTAVAIGIATFWPVIWQSIISFDKPFILSPAFYNKYIASVAGIILAFLIGLVALSDLQKYHSFIPQMLASCAVGLVCFGLMFRLSSERILTDLACGICAFSCVAVLIKLALNLNHISQIACGVAHLGLLLLVVTAGLSSDKQIIQTVLGQGKKAALGEYELFFESFKQKPIDGLMKEGPEIVVTKQFMQKRLWPHRSLYPNGQSASEVALRMGLLEDVYISFDRINREGAVTVTAKVKPFMSWLWLSVVLIIAGPALGLLGVQRSTKRK